MNRRHLVTLLTLTAVSWGVAQAQPREIAFGIISTESTAKNEYALLRHNNSSQFTDYPYEVAFVPAFSCDLAVGCFRRAPRLGVSHGVSPGRCIRRGAEYCTR